LSINFCVNQLERLSLIFYRVSMKKVSIKALSIIIIVWTLDLVTKYIAEKYLSGGTFVPVIGNIWQFRLVYNTGGVFGIFQGNAVVFHVLSGLAILFLLVYYLRSPYEDNFFNTAISFVLGGALGNFTDRFFRPGVVDFIDMGYGIYRWPTYNVADMFIFFGAVILLISFYREEKNSKQRENKPAQKA